METDKANLEVEATSGGVLAKQLVAAGEAVLPGAVIGMIADIGEQYDPVSLVVPSSEDASVAEVGRPEMAVSDAAGLVSAPSSASAAVVSESERDGAVEPRLDLRHGHLAGLPPARRSRSRRGAARPPVDPDLVGGSHRIIEPTKHSSAVARSMAFSAAVPQFPVFDDMDLTAACRALDRIRSSTPEATLTDLMVAATAVTLNCHRKFNSWYDGGRRIEFADINISLAVDGPDGVVAPVIRRADSLALEELILTRQGLVERARSRRLTPDDLVGGTFTVSNLGPLGASAVAPMIVPPQTAVLGVGRLRAAPGAETVTMTLVSDHRAVDGADAARFLAGLSAALNDPAGG